MDIYYYFFILLITFNYQASSDIDITFKTYVSKITSEIDPINEAYFSGSEEFRYLLCNLKEHKNSIINGLSNRLFTKEEMYTIALLLHGLEINDLALLLTEIHIIFNNGLIDNNFLKKIIIPSHNWSTIIPENYENNNVIDVLNKMKDDKKVEQSIKNNIKEILSGETKRKILSSREFYETLPKESISSSLRRNCNTKQFYLDK